MHRCARCLEECPLKQYTGEGEKLPKLHIDGRPVEVREGTTVLDAARQAGIDIPTLCYLKGLNAPGACRVCLVQVEGAANHGRFLCPARRRRHECIYPQKCWLCANR